MAGVGRRYASKLKVLEDVEDVVGIERGLEAFVFGTDLRGGVSAQDGHGEAADGRKVLTSRMRSASICSSSSCSAIAASRHRGA